MSIFDDLASMPDETEITLGDKTIKLGDLKGEYTQERTEREALATERDRYRGEYEKLGASVASLLGKAGEGAEHDINQPPPADPQKTFMDSLRQLVAGEDPADALYNDKLFGKALTRAEERAYERAMVEQKKLSESFTQLQDLVNKGFQNLATAQVMEREHRWYDVNRNDVPKGQDGKKYTLEQIQQYADQNGFVVPNTRLRDLDRALDSITAPERRKTEIEGIRQEAYNKGLQDARSAAGKVIPLMSDRSAGGVPKEQYKTEGKSARQIVQERLAQGLAELSTEEAG